MEPGAVCHVVESPVLDGAHRVHFWYCFCVIHRPWGQHTLFVHALGPNCQFSRSVTEKVFIRIDLQAKKESTKQKADKSVSDYHTMVLTSCSLSRSVNFARNSLTEWKVGNATEETFLRVPMRISSIIHGTRSVAWGSSSLRHCFIGTESDQTCCSEFVHKIDKGLSAPAFGSREQGCLFQVHILLENVHLPAS